MEAQIQEHFQSKDMEERKRLLTEKWHERLGWLEREAECERIPEPRP